MPSHTLDFRAAFTPFGKVSSLTRYVFIGSYALFVFAFWTMYPSPLLPRPSTELLAYQELLSKHDLFLHFWSSFMTSLQSNGLMLLIGLSLAYLSTLPAISPVVEFISKFRFISLIGLPLVFMLMLGMGNRVKVGMIVFSLGVYFLTAMADVIASVDAEQLNDARTMRMKPWHVLYEVVILGKADAVFEVFRQVAAMATMMLTTAEMQQQSGGGIGTLLYYANKEQRLDLVLALQLLVLLWGFIQDYAIRTARDQVCRHANLSHEKR